MSKSIAVLGSDQVPLAYTVPVPGTLTPLTASAVFNGSGAGAFLPAVSFYDSDGNLITRATAPEVAAGGSAEVSWFPGGELGGTGTAFASSWATLFDNSITVPAGATYTQYDFTPAAFYTNDSTTFTVDSTNGLKLNSDGWYQLGVTLSWSVSSAATGYAEMLWNIPNIGHRTSYCVFADDGGVVGLATTYHAWGFPMKAATVGSHGKLFLRQFGSSDADCALSFGIALLSSSSGNF